MKQLIIRADDLGLSEAVTLGCLSAIKYGIVTSAGMIVNMETSDSAAELVKEEKGLCLGLHFNIIVGKPCADKNHVKTMVDENGDFVSSQIRRSQINEGIDPFIYEEVFAEAQAQIKRFAELNGRLPDYMDSHSVITPSGFRALRDAAEESGIRYLPIRGNREVPWRRLGENPTQYEFYKKKLPYWRYLEEPAMRLEEGELGLIVMHPGFLDQKVMELSSLTLDRMRDHDFLVSGEVYQWIREHQITLVSFLET